MLSGHDVICFAMRAWDSPWKNNQQLMSRLAASNRVLYVNPPRPLRAVLNGVGLRLNGQPPSMPRGTSLHVLRESVLLPTWGRNHAAARLFNKGTDPVRLMRVRSMANRLGFTSPILWIYDPLAVNAIGRFRERLVIYYLIDSYEDYIAPDKAWRATITASHRKLLEQADVVFAVSESLHRQALEVNPNSFLIPNGVDFELFQTAAHEPMSSVPAMPSPVIGYVGAIRSVLDLELLEYVATHRPQWSLLLVGPEENLTGEDRGRLAHLARLSNVFRKGPQPLHRLPAFISRCDVALLPYRLWPVSQFGDSLKLYEYLACGKPIVSTDIASARRFHDLVEIAKSSADFLRAIESSLEDAPERASARKREAKQHSWTQRVEDLSTILKARLDVVQRKTRVPHEGATTSVRKAANWQLKVKRILDFAVAGIGLVALAPVLVVIAGAICLTSSGPVLYRWPVVGEGGRPLKAFKFRTMVAGADALKKDLLNRNEAKGPVFKMRNDPRVTPVGRVLRKFSLDELPQLWTVLKGNMSLVGPRPVLVEEWEQMDAWQRRKLSMKPGIVCLWHVRGQPRDLNEWVKLDLEYVDNWSLWLDMKLLLWTPLYALSGRNF